MTVLIGLALLSAVVHAQDPLPSWSDGKAKQAIVAFVAKVTKEGAPDFVPPAERIATFDNDGTLWAEQPMYFQLLFALDRVKALAPQHPEWQDKEPFASLLKGDVKGALAGGERAMLDIVMVTHAGMTTEEFEKIVQRVATGPSRDQAALHRDGLSADARTARLSARQRLQDLHRLRRRHRVHAPVGGKGLWRPARAGHGSSIKTKFELRDGKPVLMRLPEVNFIDDKTGKPIGINEYIGRRPIAAFGNSDGDLEMLQWTTAGRGCPPGAHRAPHRC